MTCNGYLIELPVMVALQPFCCNLCRLLGRVGDIIVVPDIESKIPDISRPPGRVPIFVGFGRDSFKSLWSHGHDLT